MNRVDFIKRLLALGAAAAIPQGWARQYDKFYLLPCFVRGFQFHEGPGLLAQMSEGEMLELVREPQNEHDENAIALHWNGHMIGYIPREENRILSRLMDIGTPELMAELTHINPQAKTWENVHIAVFMLKERARGDYKKIPPGLRSLETPKYYTLKIDGETVTRYTLKKPEKIDYYRFLETHSLNDSIYGMIHENLNGTTDYGIDDRLFVIKRETLKKNRLLGKVTQAADELSALFHDEHGYVVLRAKDAAELVPKLKNLAEAPDKVGNVFIELIL